MGPGGMPVQQVRRHVVFSRREGRRCTFDFDAENARQELHGVRYLEVSSVYHLWMSLGLG